MKAALAGQEVITARGEKPVVRLVPVERTPFELGRLDGQLGEVPDFLEPMDEEELRLLIRGFKHARPKPDLSANGSRSLPQVPSLRVREVGGN